MPTLGPAKLPQVSWLQQLERPNERRNEKNNKMQPWPIPKVGLLILALYCSRFNLEPSPPSQDVKTFRHDVALYNQFFKMQEVPAEKVNASTTVSCSNPTEYCLSLIPQGEALIPAAFQVIQDLLYPPSPLRARYGLIPLFPKSSPLRLSFTTGVLTPKLA